MTVRTIGCLPSLSCRHCVKPANSAPGGKATMVIGSRKNIPKSRKKSIAPLQTLLHGEFNSILRQKGLGVPSLTYTKRISKKDLLKQIPSIIVNRLALWTGPELGSTRFNRPPTGGHREYLGSLSRPLPQQRDFVSLCSLTLVIMDGQRARRFTHASLLDGCPQHGHHVLSHYATRPEALCPGDQDALQEEQEQTRGLDLHATCHHFSISINSTGTLNFLIELTHM